jgi:flap endonuclease-1
MGIKNLFKIISEHVPDSISEKSLKDLKGKAVVLDASMIIYQFVIAIRNSGKDLENNEGKMTTHIIGVINKALMLLKMDIIPIFVFDGRAPDLKADVLKLRKDQKKKCIQKLKDGEYENEDERIKDFKKSYTISREQSNEVKNILKMFGIPVIESETEADPICAKLVKMGGAYGVGSEDMDILTFGSPRLLRGVSASKKMKEIDLKKVLNGLKLNQNEFIDLCILLGCDYSSTIPKVGPKRALEIILKYRTIENFLEKESSKYSIPENFNYIEARNIFLNSENQNIDKKLLKLKKPNYNGIKEIMIDIYDFDLDNVNIYINKIKTNYLRITNAQKGGMTKYVISSTL